MTESTILIKAIHVEGNFHFFCGGYEIVGRDDKKEEENYWWKLT